MLRPLRKRSIMLLSPKQSNLFMEVIPITKRLKKQKSLRLNLPELHPLLRLTPPRLLQQRLKLLSRLPSLTRKRLRLRSPLLLSTMLRLTHQLRLLRLLLRSPQLPAIKKKPRSKQSLRLKLIHLELILPRLLQLRPILLLRLPSLTRKKPRSKLLLRQRLNLPELHPLLRLNLQEPHPLLRLTPPRPLQQRLILLSRLPSLTKKKPRSKLLLRQRLNLLELHPLLRLNLPELHPLLRLTPPRPLQQRLILPPRLLSLTKKKPRLRLPPLLLKNRLP